MAKEKKDRLRCPSSHNLAQELLKDPYVFDFITTGDDTKERHIQCVLL